MCSASTTKGWTATTIQAFTTAHTLGVLDQLQARLKAYSSMTGELAAKRLVGMPPKAYRWVDEIKKIAEAFHTEDWFEKDTFKRMSEVYRFGAHETDLGDKKMGDRRVSKTPEEITKLMLQGLERNKEKVE